MIFCKHLRISVSVLEDNICMGGENTGNFLQVKETGRGHTVL